MHSKLRPSPAMIVAMIALFVSLGGTAAALSSSNTVFSDDIANDTFNSPTEGQGGLVAADLRAGSVGTSEVADNGLEAIDLNTGSVGTSEVTDNSLEAIDLAASSVGTTEIEDQAVGSIDVDNEGLTAIDLGVDSVGLSEIGTDAVSTLEVFNQSLNAGDLAENSVGRGELSAGAVGATEVGDGIITRSSNPVTIGGGAAHNGAYNTGAVSVTCAPGEELISGFGQWADNVVGDEVWISEVVPSASQEKVTVTGGNDSGNNRSLVATAMCLAV